MDTKKVNIIKADIKKALAAVEKKHNVLTHIGRITYSNHDMKFQMVVAESDGKADNFLAAQFLAKCHAYGFKPEDLGKKVNISGDVHEIIGLKVRNRKYPIITKCLHNGKEYKLTQRTVAEALKR